MTNRPGGYRRSLRSSILGRPEAVNDRDAYDKLFRPSYEKIGTMIIDCHGHYTTAPKALEEWRNRQIAGIKDPAAAPKVAELKISDDELRQSIESNQLKLMRSAAAISPSSARARASWPTTSATSPSAPRGRR